MPHPTFLASSFEMTLTDSRLQAALHAATDHIHAAIAAVSARVTERLNAAAQSSTRIAERDLLIATQFDMRRNAGVLQRVFADELTDRLEQDLAPRNDSAKRRTAAADWQTLTLVDDAEVEERMFSDRIGQQISHACESELRELAAYMGALLNTGSADNERNPLRAEVIGAAMYRGIEAVSPQPDTRKLLAREIGAELAKEMPACYAQILRGLQARGVQPVGLSVRQVDGPGNQLPGVNSGYATLNATRSRATDFDAGPSGHGRSTQHDTGSRHGPATMRDGGRSGTGTSGRHSLEPQMAANAQLMTLLRQLTAIASRPGEFDPAPASWSASGSGARSTGGRFGASSGGTPPWSASRGPITSSFGGAGGASRFAGDPGDAPFAADGMTHLAAVNLIRAHRDELMQASNGQLDHMVIDVVGSLFDQILSDSRVPPQMARQIARLQLPVLRVALSDPSFFSSRRHPVRRFVNRIASLACAFDDFDDGPGRQFLERVRALVQEIVDGDFDQIELYAGKLAALENFIADQTGAEVEQQGTAATLGSKESELRLQQRYTMQLQSALQPMALPSYLHEFLAQVWSQALVLAASRDGAESDRAARYRRVGRDLVMSVQPKGSPALRKRFLMQLPPLMKDLNEGMALIGWPEVAQREFFGKLLPAHAESLKGAAQSELDHNLMVKQLEGIFGIAVPGVEQLSAADAVPELDGEVIAQRFSAEEALQVGLVSESAVDWSGHVDIDLGALGEGDEGGGDSGADSTDASALDTDAATLPLAGGIDLDLGQPDPAEPSRGAGLIDHIKLGFAYQMHLKDDWQKVRLAHVSAGRSFFVFTRGRKHQETISMTSRMLARMCETGRLRAVESAYLMERATRRARKQLAAMGAPAGH